MARIRSIKPEFFTSMQVADLSTTGRLLFIATWVFADDGGIHPWSPKLLKMEAMPGDEITLEEVEQHLQAMEKVKLIHRFTGADGIEYFAITGWHHQRIEKPRYRYPQPLKSLDTNAAEIPVDDQSTTSRRPVDDQLPLLPDRKRPETIGNISGSGSGKADTGSESGESEFDTEDPILAEAMLRTVDPLPAEILSRGVFHPLKEPQLKSVANMVEWHARQLSARSPVVGDTEAHLLLVICAAIHASRMRPEDVKKSRVAVFIGIVKQHAWGRVARFLPEARQQLDALRASMGATA